MKQGRDAGPCRGYVAQVIFAGQLRDALTGQKAKWACVVWRKGMRSRARSAEREGNGNMTTMGRVKRRTGWSWVAAEVTRQGVTFGRHAAVRGERILSM